VCRNLGYFDEQFQFFSPTDFDFPAPFLILGARRPPFDVLDDRLSYEPLVVQSPISKFEKRFTVINAPAYIYGLFYNSMMLWHALFDVMIPFWNFLQLRNESEEWSQRLVFLRQGSFYFNELARVFAPSRFLLLPEETPVLFESVVLGIEKLGKKLEEPLHYRDSILFEYDVNESTVAGLREAVLENFSIYSPEMSPDDPPLVLLIDRGAHPRTITNLNELATVMFDGCPYCTVERVMLHTMNLQDQLSIISRASVLVGLHGSGLANVMWMAKWREERPTHLVEILPYGYVCRNWYETAAKAAGVKYHSLMNVNRPNVSTPDLEYCWDHPEACPEQRCHDALRDQPVTVELDAFASLWAEIVHDFLPTVSGGSPGREL
jgi:hypothetical protein